VSRAWRGWAAACCALLVLAIGGPGSAAPLLDALGREASLALVGRVVGVSEHAGGALRTYAIEPVQVFRGRSPDSLSLLEERPAIVPWAAVGETLLLLLSRAPSHSFFREHLPAGVYFIPVAQRDGVIPLEADRFDLAAAILAASPPKEGQGPDLPLVRRELQSGQERLALDGVHRLVRQAKPDAELTPLDIAAVRTCLDDARVGTMAKRELVRWLGARPVSDARTVLEGWRPASAELHGERVEALAAHGKPPDPEASARHLVDSDPEFRRLGIREVALEPTPENLRTLGLLALGDPEPDIRIEAIEGLGRTDHPRAVTILQRTFESDAPDLRRASARALSRMSDGHAEAAFLDLVLYGESYDVQRYALMLLLAEGVSRDDPRIERIQREHPDDRIRALLVHGIQRGPH